MTPDEYITYLNCISLYSKKQDHLKALKELQKSTESLKNSMEELKATNDQAINEIDDMLARM